jgi:hypothetical protein
MKNNVINSQFSSIQFGDVGSIEIIGIEPESRYEKGSVLVLVKSVELDWLRLSTPDFCKNCIKSSAPDDSTTVIMVFQFSIEGVLRNPKQLLKSIRNRLMGAINAVIAEIEEEEDREIQEKMNAGCTLGEAMDDVMFHGPRNLVFD